MNDNDGSVIVTRQDAVAILTLNEPQSLNALSPVIKAMLEENLPALVLDPQVRALVITGTGRAFCAGNDERASVATRERVRRSHRWRASLLSADKPVITAVNGVAAGGTQGR